MQTFTKNNIENNELEKALIEATRRGNFERVRLLLKNDLNRTICNRALIAAIESNHLNIVKFLLEKGADPNCVNSCETAVMMATRKGHFAITRYLIDKQPELLDSGHEFVIGSNGQIALIMASSQGHFDMVRYLLEKRPTLLDDVNSYSNDTPLISASQKGHFNIVQYLLKKLNKSHKFLDRPNLKGDTALMLASDTGNVKIVRLLLDYGANLNYVNQKAQTALFMAARNNKLEVVRLLLNRGATITRRFTVNHRYGDPHVSQRLRSISNFFERNPELGLIPRNQDQQIVSNWARISETVSQEPISKFFTDNPTLSFIPINLKQAITEIFHVVANQEVPASELVRACRLITSYYASITAFRPLNLTTDNTMSFILQYKTMLKEVVDQWKDTTAEGKEKAKVTINRLPPEIMLMIMEYDIKNVCENLEEMASQHNISLTLLRDVYNHFEKNSAAIIDFYDALDHHDWCEPWVRSTVDNTLRP